jgi:hypothetical protein
VRLIDDDIGADKPSDNLAISLHSDGRYRATSWRFSTKQLIDIDYLHSIDGSNGEASMIVSCLTDMIVIHRLLHYRDIILTSSIKLTTHVAVYKPLESKGVGINACFFLEWSRPQLWIGTTAGQMAA